MNSKKVTFLTSIGAGLEYYDFVIYGMMAPYLSSLFFDGDNPSIQLMKTFAIFAVGYLFRPLGGIFFGVLADNFGRKKSFLTVMLIMAVATFSIGLLPTYSQAGNIAIYLLVLCRVLQGISFGAEIPGAITIVSEFNAKNKGIHCGMVISSTAVGSVFAAVVLYLLSSNLSLKLMSEWGWRLPFLLGGILAVVSYIMRSRLQETPEFVNNKVEHKSIYGPLLILLKQHPKTLILGTLVTFFVSSLLMGNLYYPSYLHKYYGYNLDDIYLCVTISLVLSAILVPIGGWLSDKITRRKFLMSIIICFLLSGYFMFSLLAMKTFGVLLAFILLTQAAFSLAMAAYFPVIAELFPTEIRYTGIATCYNLSYAFCSLLPMFASFMIESSGDLWFILWLLLAIAVVSLFSCVALMNARKY